MFGAAAFAWATQGTENSAKATALAITRCILESRLAIFRLPASTNLDSVLLQKSLDKPRINLPRPEILVRQNLAVKRNGCVHALDDKHLQSPRHPGDGLVAVLAAHDQLGD